MNSTEFKIIKVDDDGTTNYIMYKKKYFFFGLFWQWELVVDTEQSETLTRYILKHI